MKRYIALFCLGLAACSETSAIEDAVRQNLIDPESARFGEIIEYTDKDGSARVCVEVNAKNRMGGYVGEKLMTASRAEDGNWSAGGNLDSGLFGGCAGYIEYRKKTNK